MQPVSEPHAPTNQNASEIAEALSELRKSTLAEGELQICTFDAQGRSCLVTFLLEPEEYHA